jgi:superfamily II RNA helicase
LIDHDCYLVLLSATIGNIPALLEWLNSIVKGKVFKSVVKTERPVPLKEWVINDGKILPINNENYDLVKKHWCVGVN